jgi:hypothetical protein
MCAGLWWGNLRESDHWVDPYVDKRIILKWMEGRDVHRVLVGKPDGRRPLGRPILRWEDSINTDGW